ncbi:uncharacterized protein LOC120632343 [Pararge aegeria]|uniref:uncharacterized protein LOC120631902 n=1 Tax=Pararge aegeria TaxID=116150 RepID=UPI0019D21EEC|nr:uncharacterized protein LOC120631902 [Pararge aegeria]XP_039758131.1 uncharacterized protein LOC120632343 [Pararge aegeria]
MLDSLVRVSRRVLRVPENDSSQTETRTVRDITAATTVAPRRCPRSGRTATLYGASLRRAGRARCACAIRTDTVRQPAGNRRGPAEGEPTAGRIGRRLSRRRTGRDALLREKCTTPTD